MKCQNVAGPAVFNVISRQWLEGFLPNFDNLSSNLVIYQKLRQSLLQSRAISTTCPTSTRPSTPLKKSFHMDIPFLHVQPGSSILSFHLSNDATAKQLCEQIGVSFGVDSSAIRLLCRGKILKRDQTLLTLHPDDAHPIVYSVKKSTVIPQSLPPSTVPSDSIKIQTVPISLPPQAPPTPDVSIPQSPPEQLMAMGFTDRSTCDRALSLLVGNVDLAAKFLSGGDLSIEAAEVIGGQWFGAQFGAKGGLEVIEWILCRTCFQDITEVYPGTAWLNDKRVSWTVNRVIANGFLKQFYQTTIEEKLENSSHVAMTWFYAFENLSFAQKEEVRRLGVDVGVELAVQLYVLADYNLNEAFNLLKRLQS
jgi:hypothetical protein